MWGSRGLEWMESPSYQLSLFIIQGLPGDSVVKNLLDHVGDVGSIPGWGRFLGEGNGHPLQDSCLHRTHGQKSLGRLQPKRSQRVRWWPMTTQNDNDIYNPTISSPEWQVLGRRWMRWSLFLTLLRAQSLSLISLCSLIKAMVLVPSPRKLFLLRALKHMKLIIPHLNEKGGEPQTCSHQIYLSTLKISCMHVWRQKPNL